MTSATVVLQILEPDYPALGLGKRMQVILLGSLVVGPQEPAKVADLEKMTQVKLLLK